MDLKGTVLVKRKLLSRDFSRRRISEAIKTSARKICVLDESGHRQLSNTTQIRYHLHLHAHFVAQNFPSDVCMTVHH